MFELCIEAMALKLSSILMNLIRAMFFSLEWLNIYILSTHPNDSNKFRRCSGLQIYRFKEETCRVCLGGLIVIDLNAVKLSKREDTDQMCDCSA